MLDKHFVLPEERNRDLSRFTIYRFSRNDLKYVYYYDKVDNKVDERYPTLTDRDA
ncbi:MAG: hypothetical protein ACLU4J_02755 [Butyricimonas paravirosa]